MKSTKYLLIGIMGMLVMASCKKDDAPPIDTTPDEDIITDTTESNPMFPTTLGSYWVYDNGDTAKIAADYVETWHYDPYTPNWWPAPAELPDSQQVWSPYYTNPFFKSGIFRNFTFYPDSYYAAPPYKIMSEVNDTWVSRPNVNVDDVHVVMVRDSAMTFLGESMEVTVVRSAEESDLMLPEYTGDPEFWGTYRYYAKNIGLIRTEYRTYPDSTQYTIDLVEYYLAP